jgi:hypothetical protein
MVFMSLCLESCAYTCIVKRQRLYEYPTVVIDSNDIRRASTRQTRSPNGATFSPSHRHVNVLSDVLNNDFTKETQCAVVTTCLAIALSFNCVSRNFGTRILGQLILSLVREVIIVLL